MNHQMLRKFNFNSRFDHTSEVYSSDITRTPVICGINKNIWGVLWKIEELYVSDSVRTTKTPDNNNKLLNIYQNSQKKTQTSEKNQFPEEYLF
jgi:hypothetical protein